MTNEKRSIGVTVGWLAVLAVAGLGLVNLVRTLTSVRTAPEAVARPTPAETGAQDGAFEPISLDVEALGQSSAETTAPDYARIRELEAVSDVDALEALALSPIVGEGLAEEQLQHERRLRVSALHALATVGGQDAILTLRSVLEDGRQELVLRLAAVSALARTGDDAELAYLRTRLDAEPNRIVREKISQELERRGDGRG